MSLSLAQHSSEQPFFRIIGKFLSNESVIVTWSKLAITTEFSG